MASPRLLVTRRAGQQVRRLPVMSRSKQLVGIVSLGDIATKVQVAEKDAVAGEALGGVSQQSGKHSQTGGNVRRY